jgi:hypothetical protein
MTEGLTVNDDEYIAHAAFYAGVYGTMKRRMETSLNSSRPHILKIDRRTSSDHLCSGRC